MTLAEQLEILQAAKRGEKIDETWNQYKSNWWTIENPQNYKFDFVNKKYRIADPYAELKAAAKDPTKQIRCVAKSCSCNEWLDSPCRWTWCYPPKTYEIRDKPKAKKVVKYLCVESPAGFLGWSIESSPILSGYKRRPAFDKECEVEDDL